LLLLFKLLQFSRCPIDLGLLGGYFLLQLLFLLLPRLHLVADQGAADQAYRGSDTSAGAGISCSAANNGAQTGAGNGPDSGALLPSRQRLRTTEKERPQKYCCDDRARPFHGVSLIDLD
jgi:hypothetical protein